MLEKKDLEMIAEIVKEIVEPVKEDVGHLKEDVGHLKEDVGHLKEDVGHLKEDVEQLKKDMDRVNLILENETNRNIQIIAEGHVDLSRKMNEVLKMKEDDEMRKIRLNRLESEMEILKKNIG